MMKFEAPCVEREIYKDFGDFEGECKVSPRKKVKRQLNFSQVFDVRNRGRAEDEEGKNMEFKKEQSNLFKLNESAAKLERTSGKTKKRKNFMKLAILNCLRKQELICRFCRNRLTSGTTCKKHKVQRKGMPIECEFCEAHFSAKSLLSAHIQLVHCNLMFGDQFTSHFTDEAMLNIQKAKKMLTKYSRIR